MDEGITSKRTK